MALGVESLDPSEPVRVMVERVVVVKGHFHDQTRSMDVSRRCSACSKREKGKCTSSKRKKFGHFLHFSDAFTSEVVRAATALHSPIYGTEQSSPIPS